MLPSLLSTPVETSASPSGENLNHFTGASITGCAALQSVKFSLGGDGEIRTRVQESFALKELQQFFNKGLIKTQQQLLLFQ